MSETFADPVDPGAAERTGARALGVADRTSVARQLNRADDGS